MSVLDLDPQALRDLKARLDRLPVRAFIGPSRFRVRIPQAGPARYYVEGREVTREEFEREQQP